MIRQLLSGIFKSTKPFGFVLPCGRYIDPLKAFRELVKANVNKLIDERADNATYYLADVALCKLVREVFALPELDNKGQGYDDQLVLDTLDNFLRYIEKKEKRENASVTLPQPMAASPLPLKKNDCGCH